VGSPVLLVDLGGVLFEFDHPHRLNVLGDCLDLPPAHVDALLWKSGFSADCDAGRYPDAGAVRIEIRHITGYDGSGEDLDSAWCSAFRPDPAVLDLLAERQTPIALGIFTNNGPLEEEALVRLHPQAFEPFECRFFCHRLSANKPDEAVFRQVSDLLGESAGEIRFIDDSADNVDAARRCGWTAVEYHSPTDIAELLTP
jgi:putative hydrolase of the HAD superfamily